MRVAVAGLGTIGRRHVSTLAGLDGVDVVAGADVKLSADEQLGIPLFRSYEEMLEEVAGDAVVLCTPSWLHAEQGVLAARAGLHIIAEKPLATTLEAADEVLAACADSGVRLAVLHQYRFHTPLVALKRAIDGGRLGRLAFVNLLFHWRRDPSYFEKDGGWRGTWRGDGGGALMNQGAHAVDLARWLGGPIESVMAGTTNVQHSIEAEDTVCVVLRFANGGLGMIQVTTCASHNHPAVVQIQGTEASASVSGAVLSFNGGEPVALGEPVAPHALQFTEIFRALAAGEPPPVEGEDARQTLADTLAMYESARGGLAVSALAGSARPA